jgi:uncharacterized pyridoxamine 5'-phosphate oxidase family protein
MDETPAEVADLQRLLDASFARASPHLTGIMTPPRRLRAERLVADLPSPAVLNLATVTARGEQRLSAVDGHFLHGHWYFSTDAGSPKARQLDARPAVSVSFTPRDGYGVFAHGRVARVADGGPERDMFEAHWALTYGQPTGEMFDIGIYVGRVDADWLVGFAMTDEEEAQMAEAAAARAQRRAAAGPA